MGFIFSIGSSREFPCFLTQQVQPLQDISWSSKEMGVNNTQPKKKSSHHHGSNWKWQTKTILVSL